MRKERGMLRFRENVVCGTKQNYLLVELCECGYLLVFSDRKQKFCNNIFLGRELFSSNLLVFKHFTGYGN